LCGGRGWHGRLARKQGQRCAHRYARPRLDTQLLHQAIFERLDVDDALLRFDERHDIAPMHLRTRRNPPLDERARLHVRPE
jgi:hypothetical protein